MNGAVLPRLGRWLPQKRRLFWLLILALAAVLAVWHLFNVRFLDLGALQIRDDILLVGAVQDGSSIVQSFVATQPYLSSVHFLLNSPEDLKHLGATYQLFLRLEDERHEVLARKTLIVPYNGNRAEVDFTFWPQRNSAGRTYYLVIQSDARPGAVGIWSSTEDNYSQGAIYLRGGSSPFDLTFWTYYTPPLFVWLWKILATDGVRLLSLLATILTWLCLGLSLAILLRWHFEDSIEAVVLSLVVGAVLPAIIASFLGLLKLRVSPLTLLGPMALMLVFAVGRLIIAQRGRPGLVERSPRTPFELPALGLMFVLATVTRVGQVHGLLVPSWIDGIVHMGLVTRMIQTGMVPFDAIYPKGFHADVVMQYFLLGGHLSEVMLVVGQGFSLASGLGFYLLARRILKQPYGLLATGLYWFWVTFPAFLINWSRYPFLEGLFILPAAMLLLQDVANGKARRIGALALLVGGLGLSYYGCLLLLAAYVVPLLVDVSSRMGMRRAIKIAAVMIVAASPLILVLVFRLAHAITSNVLGQDATLGQPGDVASIGNIVTGRGDLWLAALGLVGVGFAIRNAHRQLLIVCGCTLIAFLFQLPQLFLNVTVSSLANTLVFLAIPATLLATYAFRVLALRYWPYFTYLPLLCAILLCVGAVPRSIGTLRPTTILFRSADQDAVQWIKRNTNPSSTFLVNAFLWGNDRAPSDGGGWISFLAGRQAVLYSSALSDGGLSSSVDYVYLGEGFGELSQERLASDPELVPVYVRDGVHIYKVNK